MPCLSLCVHEFLIARARMCVCLLFTVCLYLCPCGRQGDCSGPWETGGLTRMYDSFNIHLQTFFLPSFTPSLSLQHTSSHLITHTYTHTYTLQKLPSFTIMAFSQSWQIRGVLGIQSHSGLSLVLAPIMEVKPSAAFDVAQVPSQPYLRVI